MDISVVGEPFNFNGVDGASSWGIGDGVTGLLTLSGTILGIFGSNSVTGLSGTTVDNFATQTISAKMGAVEYTIADMGYPVYANSYGIYTLSQVQQYGDYMGTPLSQDISPWLRPRLVRKETSAKEVVAAWPVRSKNQYRLAFADGYVLTMTVNNGQQSAPTFSQQKYFVDYTHMEVPEPTVSMYYSGEALVPAAISSQLDEGGEERIHIANRYVAKIEDVPTPTIEWVDILDNAANWTENGLFGTPVSVPPMYYLYTAPIGINSLGVHTFEVTNIPGLTGKTLSKIRCTGTITVTGASTAAECSVSFTEDPNYVTILADQIEPGVFEFSGEYDVSGAVSTSINSAHIQVRAYLFDNADMYGDITFNITELQLGVV